MLRCRCVLSADSDEAGHAFQFDAGHPFRDEAGHRSELKPASGAFVPAGLRDDVLDLVRGQAGGRERGRGGRPSR